MKYFTKEFYEEMQVYSFLTTIPESKAEWEELILHYEKSGEDYKKKAKEDLELYKSDLIRILPTPFHRYIEDGTINAANPPIELTNMLQQWKRNQIKELKYWQHNITLISSQLKVAFQKI